MSLFSIFRECLENALVEHDLVDEVPIADHLRTQYIQHGCLVGPVIHCLIGSQVFVTPKGCLAAMLQ